MATTADYGLGEFTYPRGWFMVARSDEVTATPIGVRYFGEEMVMYRGAQSGKVFMVEAYCPHMGTHLARNTTSISAGRADAVRSSLHRLPGRRESADGHPRGCAVAHGPHPSSGPQLIAKGSD